MSHALADNNRDLDIALAHDKALVRDLQSVARGYGYPTPRIGDLPGAPALAADEALRRVALDLDEDDWSRVRDTDPDQLRARLPDWRERGRDLLDRDAEVVTVYGLAQAGDEEVRAILRAPESEGGYGLPDLAWASTWDKTDRSGMSLQVAMDDIEATVSDALECRKEMGIGFPDEDDGWDRGMLRACSDYEEVRDYQDGDAHGPAYR